MFEPKRMTLLAIIASCINMIMSFAVNGDDDYFVTIGTYLFGLYVYRIIVVFLYLLYLAFFVVYWKNLNNHKTFRYLTGAAIVFTVINCAWLISSPILIEYINTGKMSYSTFNSIGVFTANLTWPLFSLGLFLSKPSSKLLRIAAGINIAKLLAIPLLTIVITDMQYKTIIQSALEEMCIIFFLICMYVTQNKTNRRLQS